MNDVSGITGMEADNLEVHDDSSLINYKDGPSVIKHDKSDPSPFDPNPFDPRDSSDDSDAGEITDRMTDRSHLDGGHTARKIEAPTL